MAKKLKLPEVRKRVKALADANPDYVYDRPAGVCVYFGPDGAPSCLVGQALAPELAAIGVGPGSGNNDDGISDLADDLNLTKSAREWLSNVQMRQDERTPWGRAVELADLYRTLS